MFLHPRQSALDRSQSLFYFVPQERQAGSVSLPIELKEVDQLLMICKTAKFGKEFFHISWQGILPYFFKLISVLSIQTSRKKIIQRFFPRTCESGARSETKILWKTQIYPAPLIFFGIFCCVISCIIPPEHMKAVEDPLKTQIPWEPELSSFSDSLLKIKIRLHNGSTTYFVILKT